MQLTGRPFYFEYQFPTRPDDQGRVLAESSGGYDPADNAGWVTIPWEKINEDPEGQVTPDGWTFLFGDTSGAWFSVQAEVRLADVTTQAQSHVRLQETETADGPVVRGRTAWEWEIGARETHTAHITGSWSGHLRPGRRLRLAVDLWHSPEPCRIVGADVSGFYWRS